MQTETNAQGQGVSLADEQKKQQREVAICQAATAMLNGLEG